MTDVCASDRPVAETVVDTLLDGQYDLIAGTPCGMLAPLFAELEARTPGLCYVHREDTAVAYCAGVALAGGRTLLLMQNSGLGQSVNVLASLVVPFRIPLALVISLRGTDLDTTEENLVMGRATEPVLAALGISARTLDRRGAAESVRWLNQSVGPASGAAALLAPPRLFGWSPER